MLLHKREGIGRPAYVWNTKFSIEYPSIIEVKYGYSKFSRSQEIGFSTRLIK
jgi:hypothetical protein